MEVHERGRGGRDPAVDVPELIANTTTFKQCDMLRYKEILCLLVFAHDRVIKSNGSH